MRDAGGKAVAGGGLPARGRWGMAVRGFVCQNVAIGCAFGGVGVSIAPLRDHYHVGTGTATLGLSLAVLAMGLVSPVVGTLIGRVGLRPTMMIGALLSVLGYLVLAFAPSIGVVLAAFTLLVGIGMAMCGTLPSSVLASNWFQPNPGRAIGFVNMSVMVALVPLASVPVLEAYGLRGFYLMLAGLCALLIPIIWGVRDGPEGAAVAAAPDAVADGGGDTLPAATLLRSAAFWTVVIGGGALSAVGIVGISHIVAFGMERGVAVAQASLLVSVMGGASVLGSLLSGLLCDRIGGARTLVLTALALCASWVVLLGTTLLPPLVLAVLVAGACGGGIFPSVNVLLGHLYGMATLPRALGVYGMMTLPFTALLPSLAGVLHDASGRYDLVAAIIIASCGAVAVAFYAMARIIARRLAVRGALPAGA